MRFLLFAHLGALFFMHNNENESIFSKIARFMVAILPVLFWLSLIFSFDTPKIAMLTLIAVAIHECGHFITMLLLGKDIKGFRGAISGLRIKSELCSYGSEFIIYAAGPLANVIAAMLSAFFFTGEHMETFCTVNIATALSNLLPIEGYDGYGMLRCLMMKRNYSYLCFKFLEYLSLFTVAVFCILSLYLMDRFGEGYWIFFVFFVSLLKKASSSLKDDKNEQ